MTVAKKKCKCHGEYQPSASLIKTAKGLFCSYPDIVGWSKKKIKKQEDKVFNKETKRLKESIKKRTGPKGFYSNLATALHYYVKHVLRKGESCYTCGLQQCFEDSGQAFHVGHYIPQKSVDPRRFMLINLRIQCYKCNAQNSGMRAEYKQRLIEEIGIDKVEWLECDVNHKSLKEQYPEISDIKKEAAKYRKLSK
tara:strand:+ start:53 stop:637 length:585 start_codon:yes stop_codon:yes gene_type:complete